MFNNTDVLKYISYRFLKVIIITFIPMLLLWKLYNSQYLFFFTFKAINQYSGFPRRLENLENKSSHGKVMEHEKLAKGHRIL